jgi:predicted Zn finger-like uncharacterized protein
MPIITMRLSCPTCATEYEVPDSAIAGRRRKLRCGQCGHQWQLAFQAEDDGSSMTPEAPAWPVDVSEDVSENAEAFAWPQAPEDLNVFPPVLPRQFGKPVDDAAQSEIAQAVAQEEFLPHRDDAIAASPPEADEGLPMFLTAEREDDSAEPSSSAAETSRFAELIYAARNNAVDFEAEAQQRGAQRAKRSTPLTVILLVVLLAAIVLVEHRLVERFLPASARLFQALGLK